MAITTINRWMANIKPYLPDAASRFIRRCGTAFLTPMSFAIGSGHFRSSFAEKSMDRVGSPIPWYTYPCTDFLRTRSFKDSKVLEFGGGQSTLFWADRAAQVVTFEEDPAWFARISTEVSPNCQVFSIFDTDLKEQLNFIENTLEEKFSNSKFDLIVIDGLQRSALAELAKYWVSADGVIICDDSEGFGFREQFKGSEFQRIDFYGHAPGVYHPHCTSIYFRLTSPLLNNCHPILERSYSKFEPD